MWRFAARLDQEQLRAAGAFFSPSRRRWTAPAASTFHSILSSLPPDALDRALGAWSRHCGVGAPVALDGKDVRGPACGSRGGDGHHRSVGITTWLNVMTVAWTLTRSGPRPE